MQRLISAIVLSTAAGLALSSAFLAFANTPSQERVESAAPGMVIHVDPATGAFGMPPPGALDAPSDSPSADSMRTQDGWRQTADPRPGAGWKLEGPGMITSTTATVGADGKLRVDCAHNGVSR